MRSILIHVFRYSSRHLSRGVVGFRRGYLPREATDFLAWIVFLILAMAVVAASGFALSKSRRGILVRKKAKHMPIIGADGILILVPCALLLDRLANMQMFDTTFYLVQGIEFVAGMGNRLLARPIHEQ